MIQVYLEKKDTRDFHRRESEMLSGTKILRNNNQKHGEESSKKPPGELGMCRNQARSRCKGTTEELFCFYILNTNIFVEKYKQLFKRKMAIYAYF